MDADPVRVAARGQLTMSDAAREPARNRAAVIGSLAARGATGIAAADRAAAELGVSRRQVYVLLDRHRQGSGVVNDLAVRRSTGGKGGKRLPEPVEEIIRDLIRKRFPTRQKRSVAALHREIAHVCSAR
jgi:putative transposase